MYSEHLIIFSAIASSNLKIKNILEIGTYDAKTSSILATLFPQSNITTIDLKNNDPLFLKTYDRYDNPKSFIKKPEMNYFQKKNIRFIQTNSLELSTTEEIPIQDLIWVDGAHGYPFVACDITNSIKLMNKSTILMCDDIWMQSRNNDSIYQSKAGFETLESFSEANIIKNIYFRKRIGKKYNGKYKFICFSKLK